MISCDFLGLNELINKYDIKTRDTGYLYALLTILLKNKNRLTLQGEIDISSLKGTFRVSDRSNVLRILDRLQKSSLIKYRIPNSKNEGIIWINISTDCLPYFYQN